MKEHQGHNSTGVAQRLQALRSPSPQSPQDFPPPISKSGIRKEFLFGGLGVLVLVAVVYPLIGRLQEGKVREKAKEVAQQMFPNGEFVPNGETVVDAESVPVDQSGLANGEAYVAVPVESGHFPPQLSAGHIVRISVTSSQDGVSSTGSLSGTATVQSVKPISDVSSAFVITILTSEDVVDKIASAESIDLAIVGEVSQ